MPPVTERGESSVHCFVYQQLGHYATQCPLCKGKGPAVNTITTEVQQVMSRQQTKNVDWAAQDEICKTTQAWVEKENAANTESMRQESANNVGPIEENIISPDPIWQALAGCEITVTMEKLLQLVPQFRRAIEDRITGRPGVSIFNKFCGNLRWTNNGGSPQSSH